MNAKLLSLHTENCRELVEKRKKNYVCLLCSLGSVIECRSELFIIHCYRRRRRRSDMGNVDRELYGVTLWCRR